MCNLIRSLICFFMKILQFFTLGAQTSNLHCTWQEATCKFWKHLNLTLDSHACICGINKSASVIILHAWLLQRAKDHVCTSYISTNWTEQSRGSLTSKPVIRHAKCISFQSRFPMNFSGPRSVWLCGGFSKTLKCTLTLFSRCFATCWTLINSTYDESTTECSASVLR